MLACAPHPCVPIIIVRVADAPDFPRGFAPPTLRARPAKSLIELSKSEKQQRMHFHDRDESGTPHSPSTTLVLSDIKSQNIFVDASFRAKLGDFQSAAYQQSVSLTRFICGTAEFMAPEVALQRRYSVHSDVFSFGVVLSELLTAKRPGIDFMHRTEATGYRVDEPEVMASMVQGCPAALLSVCLRCCHAEPHLRPSAGNMYSLFSKMLPTPVEFSSEHPEREV